MSTENHNGSTAHTNGGVKPAAIGSNNSGNISSGGSITTTAITSSTRTISSNNTSFLYSSNSTLNRDKPRQAPPPTLPKYTASFNAGTNGTSERLAREREAGGSYRLASLDRLALRQRILDGEKTNGDIANSVRRLMR